VVLDDIVKLLDFEVVEVTFGEAVEDAAELLEVAEVTFGEAVEDAAELLEVAEVTFGEAVEDAVELLEVFDEVTDVMAELVVDEVEEVLDLLVAVIP
jgi:hypothetical protein